MPITLGALAEKLGATLHGSEDHVIHGVASLGSASSDQLSFLGSSKFYSALKEAKAGAVLLKSNDLTRCSLNALVVEDPENAFIDALALFHPEPEFEAGIHASAIVDPSAQIAEGVCIGPRVVIGPNVSVGAGSRLEAGCILTRDCQLGEQCVIHPNVTLYPGVTLGDRVIIHAGSVLGADGFSYHQSAGRWRKVPQVAGVQVGSDVEIGALTTIDCGALDDTSIGNGVKIDDNVMIGHNVIIKDHTVIAACSAIAGSSKIGQYCMLGGMVAVGDHLTVPDGTVLMGCARVSANVSEPGVYSSGTGLHSRREWHRLTTRYKQLDTLHKRVTALEKEGEKS